MSEIREIAEYELDALVTLVAQAYPGSNFFAPEARKRLKDRVLRSMREEPTQHHYGYFHDNQMQGVMKLFDFTMTLLSAKVKVGGIGTVAVDLLHKKEKVAMHMLSFFLRYYRGRDVNMAVLYPFRVDFYKQMGFGVGTKMNQYRCLPGSLPNRGEKGNVVYLRPADQADMLACYTRLMDRTNGMIAKTRLEAGMVFEQPENIIVGCKREGKLSGYLVFSFKPAHAENHICNDLFVKELIYENTDALLDLLSFLHSQADQVNRVIVQTQDEYFHHLLADPRNHTSRMLPSVYHESNVSGVGIMYRVLNVAGIFADLREHNFGDQTCRLKITVADSFLPENEGSTVVHFAQGYARLSGDDRYDAEIRLDISDFSSLLVGAVPFRQLMRYGLAEISDPAYVETVTRLFAACEKPICTTAF